MFRPANMGEDAEQHGDGSFVEDTPPDWGDSHEDLDMAESQGSDQQSSEGEEADSPANPWPWGPEGRPSDTGRSQGVLAERPAEPARAPQPLLSDMVLYEVTFTRCPAAGLVCISQAADLQLD